MLFIVSIVFVVYTLSMCGIAGFIGEDKAKIDRMTAALIHRGPDGNATVVSHGASLGHARLAILDPRPEGNQPMWNEAKTACIVYNGEIFNYRELRDEEKMECHTGTDTEVLLKLFDAYGMAFVPRLKGMFAFGIYDTQSKTWHIARDSSGIKPLYIAIIDGKLHFASEMRALLTAFPTKPPINTTALSQFVRLQYVPGPETLCEGITSLPPGTVLHWSEEHEQRAIVHPEIQPGPYRSRSDFRENFPRLMDQVVADHMIADRPLGIFLSGGMDSSIILHHMANHADKPVATFTIRFDATEEEGAARFNADAELARATASAYKTDHHEVLFTADMCRDIYRECSRSLDQPNADSVAMAQFVLAREAKKHVDVVLTGAGGDELFGGYPRYRIARILHTFRMIPVPLRARAAAMMGYPVDVVGMDPGWQLAERLLARPISEAMRIVKDEWFEIDATSVFFEERYAKLQDLDPARALMEFDRETWLVDESLRLTDATTMASGLEARVPFLDPRIIGAAHDASVPLHVTLHETKALLKHTYIPLLPKHIKKLRKACFFPPMAKWIRRQVAQVVIDAIEHPRIRQYFDADALRALFELHLAKEKYAYHTLASVAQLAAWFDEVYDA